MPFRISEIDQNPRKQGWINRVLIPVRVECSLLKSLPALCMFQLTLNNHTHTHILVTKTFSVNNHYARAEWGTFMHTCRSQETSFSLENNLYVESTREAQRTCVHSGKTGFITQTQLSRWIAVTALDKRMGVTKRL